MRQAGLTFLLVLSTATPAVATAPVTPHSDRFDPGFELELPFQCGAQVVVSQSHGTFSHVGLDTWAWDFRVPVGTPVHAVIGGTVTATTAPSSRCGLGVVVAGDDGHRWTYCHAVQVLVTAGERVRTGQPIMRSGNTGNSTGPHLHLALHVAGVARCPQPLLEAWLEGRTADPADAPATGCTF